MAHERVCAQTQDEWEIRLLIVVDSLLLCGGRSPAIELIMVVYAPISWDITPQAKKSFTTMECRCGDLCIYFLVIYLV